MSETYDVNVAKPANQLALGTAFVLAGQVVFVLCGYVLHFFLSRAVDPVAYGNYGLIINVLIWTEYALNNGMPWAVRKLLPTYPRVASGILRTGLKWQMVIGWVLYAATMRLAPWFAGVIGDSSLTFHLRLALTDILLMALYTFYRGALNGLRLFAAQGASLVAYALGKLGSSLLLVGLGYSLSGALVGNVLGSLVGWLAALALLRRGTRAMPGNAAATTAYPDEQCSGREMLAFALPMVWFTLAGTSLLNVGLVGVKAVVTDGSQVGYYSAANYLASAPTMMLVVFSVTLFPHLVASIASGDVPLTRTYIRSTLRSLALVLIPGIALVWGTSPQLMSLIYPSDYATAAPVLNLLIIMTGLYSLYMIFANAILAEGRVFLALSIPCAVVPVSLFSTWYLTEHFGPSGAAMAAVLSTGLAALASALYVLRRFAVRLDWISVARISIASLGIYALTRLYAARGALLVPYYLILGAVYLALLMGMREITWQDVRQWRADLSGAIAKWGVKA